MASEDKEVKTVPESNAEGGLRYFFGGRLVDKEGDPVKPGEVPYGRTPYPWDSKFWLSSGKTKGAFQVFETTVFSDEERKPYERAAAVGDPEKSDKAVDRLHHDVEEKKQKILADGDLTPQQKAAKVKEAGLTDPQVEKRTDVEVQNTKEKVEAERESEDRTDTYKMAGRWGLPLIAMLGGAIGCSMMGGVGGFAILATCTIIAGVLAWNGVGSSLGGSLADHFNDSNKKEVEEKGQARVRKLEDDFKKEAGKGADGKGADGKGGDGKGTNECIKFEVGTRDGHIVHIECTPDNKIDPGKSAIVDAQGNKTTLTDSVAQEAVNMAHIKAAYQKAMADSATPDEINKIKQATAIEQPKLEAAVETVVHPPAAGAGQGKGAAAAPAGGR